MRIPEAQRITSKILAGSSNAVCWIASPGIGKTQGLVQMALASNRAVLIQHPAYDEPIDYRGLPTVRNLENHGNVMHWLPPDNLPLDCLNGFIRPESGKRLLWILDDLGQAHPSVQNALARAFAEQERVIAGQMLANYVDVVATTNKIEDKAAVHESPTFMRMRITYLEIEPHAQDWVDWAMLQHDVPEEFITFLQPGSQGVKGGLGQKHIYDFNPIQRSSCSPRTLHIAGKHYQALKDEPDSLINEALSGILCPGFAMEFAAHRKLFGELPDVNEILAGKDINWKFAKKPDILHLVITTLIKRAEPKHENVLAEFILGMPEDRIDFAAFAYKQALKKFTKFPYNKSILKWAMEHKEMFT